MTYHMDSMPVRLDGDGPRFEEVAPRAPFAELIRVAVLSAAALGRVLRRISRRRAADSPREGGLTSQM